MATIKGVALSTVGELLDWVAESYELMRIEIWLNFAWLLAPTSAFDAWRSDAVQEKIFRQRYTTVKTAYARTLGIPRYDRRKWKGQYWYRKPGYAAAAVPGTSNHGDGTTADFRDLGGYSGKRFKQLASVAPRHGWDNVEGKKVREYWHWTKTVRSDIARIKYAGIYHTTRKTMTYDQYGKVLRSRPENFDVRIIGAIKWRKAMWGVTKSFNLYRLSHLETGRAPQVVKYKIVVDVLNVRSGPSTKSKIKAQRKKGTIVKAVKVVSGDGYQWAVTKQGGHYAIGSSNNPFLIKES